MSALPSYDAEQLADLLALLPDVDGVELKLTVAERDRPQVLGSLGIDPLDATIRQVAFVDTRSLELSAAGLVVRVRRTQHKPGDATVKLRPMPAGVPTSLRALPGFKIEVDASPAGYTCSCSLTTEIADRRARGVLAGSRRVTDVLSHDQRALLIAHLPPAVTVEDLRVLGPVTLLKARLSHPDFPRRLVAELWFLPDGSRLLELSTKCGPAEAFQAAAETKVFLAGRGVDLAAPQEAKTSTTLAALAATIEKE
jgi:hypothetical protein